jgi:transcriptional regulator with XRE-family HTH domain
MSAANLSRIESGEQGPPSDKIIERLAGVLKADSDELLQLAGGGTINATSETLLLELRQLRAEVRDGFARVQAAIQQER